MSEFDTLARPYAKAVFELAKTNNSFDQWSQALTLTAKLSTEAEVSKLITQPRVKASERADALFKVVSKAASKGQKIDESLKSLLNVLAKNERLQIMSVISKQFEQLKKAHEKEIEVEVTTAIKLPSALSKELAESLSKRFDKKANLNEKIDGKILGGMIIKTQDWVLDRSLKTQLKQLYETVTT